MKNYLIVLAPVVIFSFTGCKSVGQKNSLNESILTGQSSDQSLETSSRFELNPWQTTTEDRMWGNLNYRKNRFVRIYHKDLSQKTTISLSEIEESVQIKVNNKRIRVIKRKITSDQFYFIPLLNRVELASKHRKLYNKNLLVGLDEYGPSLSLSYSAAIRRKPFLKDILVMLATQEYNRKFEVTGGTAIHRGAPKREYLGGRFAIVMNVNQNKDTFSKLARARSATIQHCADLLGIDTGQLSEKLLSNFIFLHELGHVVDYVENYQDFERKDETRKRELNALPVPGRTPATLAQELSDRSSDLMGYINSEKGSEWFNALGVKDTDELYALQEKAYHMTKMESFADNFAKEILLELKSSRD